MHTLVWTEIKSYHKKVRKNDVFLSLPLPMINVKLLVMS